MEIVTKIQDILKQNNLTITCAESCTGGLIASEITSISGSSSIFRGSIVTYCNEIKEQELDVKKETMIKYGVVSCEVVEQMLDGVLSKFDASIAIAVSGVAGPNGGTKDKPVGTVVIGVKGIKGIQNIKVYHFKGSRIKVQQQSKDMAFRVVYDELLKKF